MRHFYLTVVGIRGAPPPPPPTKWLDASFSGNIKHFPTVQKLITNAYSRGQADFPLLFLKLKNHSFSPNPALRIITSHYLGVTFIRAKKHISPLRIESNPAIFFYDPLLV